MIAANFEGDQGVLVCNAIIALPSPDRRLMAIKTLFPDFGAWDYSFRGERILRGDADDRRAFIIDLDSAAFRAPSQAELPFDIPPPIVLQQNRAHERYAQGLGVPLWVDDMTILLSLRPTAGNGVAGVLARIDRESGSARRAIDLTLANFVPTFFHAAHGHLYLAGFHDVLQSFARCDIEDDRAICGPINLDSIIAQHGLTTTVRSNRIVMAGDAVYLPVADHDGGCLVRIDLAAISYSCLVRDVSALAPDGGKFVDIVAVSPDQRWIAYTVERKAYPRRILDLYVVATGH